METSGTAPRPSLSHSRYVVLYDVLIDGSRTSEERSTVALLGLMA